MAGGSAPRQECLFGRGNEMTQKNTNPIVGVVSDTITRALVLGAAWFLYRAFGNSADWLHGFLVGGAIWLMAPLADYLSPRKKEDAK